jgi:LysR family transcriptional regulator for bpeEF and oprC
MSGIDKFKAMEMFVRVVEAGSLVKAAETLSVRKSTVSMMLKQLEESLGTRLLQRSARRSSLTDEGHHYYEHCRAVLTDILDFENAFKGTRKSPSGKVRVDLPNTVAKTLLIPSLSDFRRQYPTISLAIGVTDRRVDLIGEAVDCVIRTGPLDDSSLIGRRIGEFQWVVCAAPGYFEKKALPTDPRELMTHDIIGYFSGGTQFIERWAFRQGGSDTEVSCSSVFTFNDTLAYIQCGLAGQGLIRLADFAAKPYLARGELVEVLRAFRPAPAPISILFPSGRHLSPAVRAFADWAAGLFSPESTQHGAEK